MRFTITIHFVVLNYKYLMDIQTWYILLHIVCSADILPKNTWLATIFGAHDNIPLGKVPTMKVCPGTFVSSTCGPIYHSCLALDMRYAEVGRIHHTKAPVSNLQVGICEVGARWCTQLLIVTAEGLIIAIYSSIWSVDTCSIVTLMAHGHMGWIYLPDCPVSIK